MYLLDICNICNGFLSLVYRMNIWNIEIWQTKKDKRREKKIFTIICIPGVIWIYSALTLIMPNYLNGIIHLTFLALSVIILRNIKMKTWSWPANSIEPGQTALVTKANHFRSWQDKGLREYESTFINFIKQTCILTHFFVQNNIGNNIVKTS